ncbi:NifB/NifX family molybdenum-iron cluster-binding protein [Azospirillum halopraeferens]|uniref:NifB/NifX family molybdenum-iron cluster-binding protein n=1 Tax=Azospirillum halopraeferens TaxID=34010 RepID=UPI0003F5C7D7|nr:NifB/NifX family molybdenum-iron cluster-binding protein [Azospirillum halopraeferens]
MRIAVATRDGATVTSHGGRARRFLVYEAEAGSEPVLVETLELGEAQALHHHGDGAPHPIDSVKALVAGTSGQGFVNHLRRRGIEPVLTAQTDPVQAIRDWFAGTLKPAALPEHPHEHHDVPDDHHHHDHRHGHHGGRHA